MQRLLAVVNILKYLPQDVSSLSKIWRFLLPKSKAHYGLTDCIPPASRYRHSSAFHSGQKKKALGKDRTVFIPGTVMSMTTTAFRSVM
jgi:hypothetical protein